MVEILSYMYAASGVVQGVFATLCIASILSWAIIVERGRFFRHFRQQLASFEQRFMQASSLSTLEQDSQLHNAEDHAGMRIFLAGYRVYCMTTTQTAQRFERIQRAMQVEETEAVQQLQQTLVWLATIGSTSPYIGLFGTVWGIIHAFSAISHMQQATLASVAPGISEALIATALGLFVAIPAVIVYNRLASEVHTLAERCGLLQEKIIQRLVLQDNV
jgi:biopolymer transport protein TolQ